MTRRESLILMTSPVAGAWAPDPQRKLNVVCVGAHPDDPESGCGGTLARYSARGHNVTIIYLTRGEAGIPGKSHDEAARIRTEEATKASALLGAKAMFAGQIDGGTEVNSGRYEALDGLISAQRPDVVFTHWPVDTHRDHCAASLLTFQAWLRSGRRYPLAYFEVMSGEQTQQFAPNFYVDLAETWEQKKQACFLHASQNPPEFYAVHEEMERFRGLEFGCKRAEGFVVHAKGPHVPVVW